MNEMNETNKRGAKKQCISNEKNITEKKNHQLNTLFYSILLSC